jgi:gamma-glutamyl:cysteine ligase YbdK (ATP-grasp superfamily)
MRCRLGRDAHPSACSSGVTADRYRALVDQMQYARRSPFGMHIHVAVDDPDKAIRSSSLLPDRLHRPHRPA